MAKTFRIMDETYNVKLDRLGGSEIHDLKLLRFREIVGGQVARKLDNAGVALHDRGLVVGSEVLYRLATVEKYIRRGEFMHTSTSIVRRFSWTSSCAK